jgi:hypothetical protein
MPAGLRAGSPAEAVVLVDSSDDDLQAATSGAAVISLKRCSIILRCEYNKRMGWGHMWLTAVAGLLLPGQGLLACSSVLCAHHTYLTSPQLFVSRWGLAYASACQSVVDYQVRSLLLRQGRVLEQLCLQASSC